MSENRKRNFEDNKNFKGRKMRKKVCPFVKNGNFELDYKDAEAIKRFISEKGKI